MYSESDWKKGCRVVKLINVLGAETASIREVCKVNKRKGLVYCDPDDLCDDGQNTYRIADGVANVCWIPGCSHRIVPLEE